MSARPRILVTGAGGFIGRHLIPELARRVPQTEIFRASRDEPVESGVLHVDLTDERACRAAVGGIRPDVVVHLAGAASVAASAAETIQTWRTNFSAAFNVACALAEQGGHAAFVLASSAEVYGAAFNDIAIVDEAVSPRPLNVYGRTKLAAEMAVGDALGDRGKIVSLRLFNSIGPGQDERFVTSAFAAQVARIEAGLVAPVVHVGSLASQRDFIDVRDVVSAIALVVEGIEGFPQGATALNVCSGTTRPVSDVLSGLRGLTKMPFEVRPNASRLRPSEVPRAAGSPAEIRRLTGWYAEVPWTRSIEDILNHWRETLRGDGA